MKRWSLLCIAIFVATAYFSYGFYHFDEQFQILEFAQAKISGDTDDLPWEYRSQTRPWFQPALYYAFLQTFSVFDIDEPFQRAFLLRLFSAFLSLVALFFLTRRYVHGRGIAPQTVIIFYALIWFLPFISVRTSAECLGTSCLALGLGFLLAPKEEGLRPMDVFWAGVFLVLSFEFRPQLALMAVGAVAWALVFRPQRFEFLKFLVLGGLGPLFLGVLADRWGYGEWVFPQLNYVIKGIYLTSGSETMLSWMHRLGIDDGGYKGVASPWWRYFILSVQHGLVLPGLVAVLVTLAFLLRFPRNILTWTVVPYLAVHFLIAHKELRYLFPIGFLVPLFMAEVWTNLKPERVGLATKAILAPVVVLNLVGLVLVSTVPPQPRIAAQRGIQKKLPKVKKIHVLGEGPYKALSLPMHFYRPQDLKVKQLRSPQEAKKMLKKEPLHLVVDGFDIPQGLQKNCTQEYGLFPRWVQKYNWFGWLEKTPKYAVYSCRSTS